MPLDAEAKKAYQRDYMARKRAEQPRDGITRAVGNRIITPGTYEPGHKHVWTRKLGEDSATCGDCAEVVAYEGKLLNQFTDGMADTSDLIRDMSPEMVRETNHWLNHPAIATKHGR